jgi:pimeloyl-ACP methyl ester carboxylesterase
LQGAAYERVDDCRQDVAAWVEFLVDRGYTRIHLVGHSLGALKILYAQAQQPLAAVSRLIAISPPCLSYARFAASRGSDVEAFRSSLATAERWIAQGQPATLFLARFPFPITLSAATFVDKYGPDERYNLLRFLPRICQPIDLIYGQREVNEGGSAFVGLVADLESLDWPHGPPRITVIRDANHFYVGCVPDLTATVQRALDDGLN